MLKIYTIAAVTAAAIGIAYANSNDVHWPRWWGGDTPYMAMDQNVKDDFDPTPAMAHNAGFPSFGAAFTYVIAPKTKLATNHRHKSKLARKVPVKPTTIAQR